MPTRRKPPPSEAPTRRAILDILKRQDPQDAAAIADQLGVSAMAVRQHLYALADQRLVTYEEAPRPVGRPAKLWRLTPEAGRFYPDGHADLTLDLIDAMKRAFGEEGLERLLAERSRRQVEAYREIVTAGQSLPKRLEALAEQRSAEGYMAEVRKEGADYLLLEHHCPICSAATACTGLCAAELEVFQSVLGPDVEVERSDHILAGASRCAYRVTKAAN